MPIATGALTVNRLCGSGFQSIVNGAHVSAENYYVNKIMNLISVLCTLLRLPVLLCSLGHINSCVSDSVVCKH